MKTIAVRLRKNDKLKESLNDIINTYKIKSEAIITGVGSINKGNIRLADGKSIKQLNDPHEIVSLTGTLSPDGVHIHISLADIKGKVIGGHLMEDTFINTTCELIIGIFNEEFEFTREYDKETGYSELSIKNN